MEVKSISQLVREMEDLDTNGVTTSSKYVTQSMREDINTTEAYLNSKHISGDTDYLGREKPFFNIVVGARNIWFRATDIDCKNIKLRATKDEEMIEAFVATIKFQEWIKKQSFGQFLNDLGLSLASHGSTVSKFIERENELIAQVMDWNNIIVDPIDFENNVKIEKLWFTPSQLLKQKGYDKKKVKELLDQTETRETITGEQKDNKSGYIPVYEVHSELPLSLLTNNEKDDETFVQQIHVVSFLAKKDNKDEYDEYTLYSGREKQDPYFITHLIKKDGQTYAGGAVKNLFEAQWMVNHSQKQIKDQLDLASKIIFQTSDGAFVGQNMLSSIENGDILKHEINQPLTRLADNADISALQAYKADWQNVANQINGISESMQGESAPSGTAWRLVQAQLQESHSLFELMTENKGLAITEMIRRYVLPFFKKQLNNNEQISAILEEENIKQIDSMYVPNEVTRRLNQKKKETILSGEIFDPGFEAADMAEANAEISKNLTGNQRFIKPSDVPNKTWKEVFDDMEFDIDIDITGEAKDVQEAMATLTTIFQVVASNPAVLQDPTVKMMFSKILNLSGVVSPLELSQGSQPPPTQQPQQQVQLPQMPDMDMAQQNNS
mgnify:CR=1 FL=1